MFYGIGMEPVVGSVTEFFSWNVDNLKKSIIQAQKNNQKIFPLVINSFGGSVYRLLEMVDMLEASQMEIVTIVNGVAMSAGAVLFAMGKRRYLSKNSTVMIHDASYFMMGKHSEVESYVIHVDELNKRLYDIFDTAAGKEPGYFNNLVKEHNGADLFFNAEEAITHGLATSIGVPSIEEIFTYGRLNQSKNIITSDFQKFQVLMQYSPDGKNQNGQEPQNKEIQNKGGKKVTLEDLMEMLTDEQKKPVQVLNLKIKELEGTINESRQEVDNLKKDYEKQLSDLREQSDKDFVDNLLNDMKLTKEDAKDALEILSALSGDAKDKYKKKLSASSKIVSGEIPDNGENSYDFSNLDDEKVMEENLRKFAAKKNMPFKTTEDIQNVYKAFIAANN